MKRQISGLAVVMVGLLGFGCGGSPPPPAPAPVVVQQAPCAESWVHMPMLIGFPTGGAIIDSQNRAILQELVRSTEARSDIRAVRVEGHTDTCGNELNNMNLSTQRADSVAQELVTMGVPRESIQTIGYGSQQPRANESCGNQQTLSEQTNRRVEFSLLVCR